MIINVWNRVLDKLSEYPMPQETVTLLSHICLVLAAILAGLWTGRFVRKKLEARNFDKLFRSPFYSPCDPASPPQTTSNPSLIMGWIVTVTIMAAAVWLVAGWRDVETLSTRIMTILRTTWVAVAVILAGAIIGRALGGHVAQLFQLRATSPDSQAASGTIRSIGIGAGLIVYVAVYLVLLTIAADFLKLERTARALSAVCDFGTRFVSAIAILATGRLGAGWLAGVKMMQSTDSTGHRWQFGVLGVSILWAMVAITASGWGTAVLIIVFLVLAVLFSVGHEYLGEITASLYLAKNKIYNVEIEGKKLKLIKRGWLSSKWKDENTAHQLGNRTVLRSILDKSPSTDTNPE
jgi:hypothetical protein